LGEVLIELENISKFVLTCAINNMYREVKRKLNIEDKNLTPGIGRMEPRRIIIDSGNLRAPIPWNGEASDVGTQRLFFEENINRFAGVVYKLNGLLVVDPNDPSSYRLTEKEILDRLTELRTDDIRSLRMDNRGTLR